jgi:hypothetical protein
MAALKVKTFRNIDYRIKKFKLPILRYCTKYCRRKTMDNKVNLAFFLFVLHLKNVGFIKSNLYESLTGSIFREGAIMITAILLS